MQIMKQQGTNTASTSDWLQASKQMTISAYDPTAAKGTDLTETSDQFRKQDYEDKYPSEQEQR